ncbi:MAG: hypothetical protein WBW53_03205 [Terriglobales bacterium]
MKHTKQMAMVALLSLGVSGAAAQSLGDYAKAVRKNKPQPSSTVRYFDNDNLPTDQSLSVVGPAPTAEAKTDAVDPAATAADRQKTADEWKTKLDDERGKIASLSHELDLEQREYRLKAAAFYGDAGTRLRDAGDWDKQEAQYKSDIDAKQKAIDSAKQQLDDLQGGARQAGVTEKEQESDNTTDSGKPDNQ